MEQDNGVSRPIYWLIYWIWWRAVFLKACRSTDGMQTPLRGKGTNYYCFTHWSRFGRVCSSDKWTKRSQVSGRTQYGMMQSSSVEASSQATTWQMQTCRTNKDLTCNSTCLLLANEIKILLHQLHLRQLLRVKSSTATPTHSKITYQVPQINYVKKKEKKRKKC